MPSDVVDPATRSRMMAGIKGKNTKPEMLLRSGLHAAGLRFRVHDRKLPGHPDIVFPKYRAIVFVNGCFWHGHNCYLFKWPESRPDFWRNKILGNVERDRLTMVKLEASGWRVLNVWECAMKGPGKLGIEIVIALAHEWIKSGQGVSDIRGK